MRSAYLALSGVERSGEIRGVSAPGGRAEVKVIHRRLAALAATGKVEQDQRCPTGDHPASPMQDNRGSRSYTLREPYFVRAGAEIPLKSHRAPISRHRADVSDGGLARG